MKALTLTQPWATLVALGEKRIETRSWATSYRGPLAIHAGAGLAGMGKAEYFALCSSQPHFGPALRERYPWAGVVTRDERGRKEYIDPLPRGVIVAVVQLVSVHRITASGVEGFNPQPMARERAFGDYSPGRYAWLLADVRPLRTPVPARGALSLWSLPADALAAVEAQL